MRLSTRVCASALAVALIGTAGVVATPASAASAPARPTAAASSGNGWVAVKWAAATANGKPVLGYQVATRRYLTATGTWSASTYVTVGSTVRSRTVAVSNGVKVLMLVRARNTLGYGTWGRVSTVAGLPAAVPGARGAAGDSEATVLWSMAKNNGSAITSYRVYSRAYSAGAWSGWSYRTTGAASRADTFTGLINNRGYEFQVRAVNARGVGAPSASVTVRPVAPPPAAPPTSAPPTTTPPTSAPPTSAPPTSAPPTSAPPTTAPTSPEIARILADTNAFRAANGKAALSAMPALDAVAGEWAKKMHDECIFEHRSSFSVYPSGWSRAGENIAAGYGYTSVVQGWIDSPGHRANMLGDYTHIGIGYYQGTNCYRTYFVQNFAKY